MARADADDINIVMKMTIAAKECFEHLEQVANERGLPINDAKIIFMHVTHNNTSIYKQTTTIKKERNTFLIMHGKLNI